MLCSSSFENRLPVPIKNAILFFVQESGMHQCDPHDTKRTAYSDEYLIEVGHVSQDNMPHLSFWETG